MTEQKLYEAAEQMSQPSGTFSAVRQSVISTRNLIRHRQHIKFAALLAAVLLLVGCGATVATYGNYSGFNWSTFALLFGVVDPENQLGLEPDYKDAREAADKLHITIPEQFGDSPFYQFETINTSTQDNWILSWFDHDYQRYWISYEIVTEVVEQEYLEDGTLGKRSETIYGNERVQLEFGSTDGELWRELFEFDENGIWNSENLIFETYETIEYRGNVLQTGTTSFTYDYYDYEIVWDEGNSELELISIAPRTYYNFVVTWIDEENGAVFRMSTDTGEGYEADLFSGVSEETLIEYAKQLIDLNS